MADSLLYHDGNIALQEQFASRALAERMETAITRTGFTDADKAFIEGALFFFLATANARGEPDCSFKGGMPGFARVMAPDELVFPDYDGNGMFKSLGNIAVNPHVGLLFIDMGDAPRRVRVNGEARISHDDPRMREFAGAQMLVHVRPRVIFPNCPRYIIDPAGKTPSQYAPRPGYEPPEPAWKGFDAFKDAVPPRRPTPRGE